MPWVCGSAPRYGNTRNVRVISAVVPEPELGHVEREVLSVDLVEGAHDAALDKRSGTVDRLRVDRADHILLAAVADDLMREIDQAAIGGCSPASVGWAACSPPLHYGGTRLAGVLVLGQVGCEQPTLRLLTLPDVVSMVRSGV